MITKYNNMSAYETAGKPTDESRVAKIVSTNEVIVDGINVMTKTPLVGDAVYHDGTNYYFFKGGDQLNHTALIGKGYTAVGMVVGLKGNKALVINGENISSKYLNVWQYAITNITSTSITLGFKMRPDYDNYTNVSVTLSSTAVNATTASEITSALESTNSGYTTHGFWAWFDETNNRIVVQCDLVENWQQYQCTATGCSVSVCVWEDMPEHSQYWRKTGKFTNYRALMNIDRGYAYWSANGSTPTENVPIHQVGNNNPVTEAAFTGSLYCSLLRETYGDYRTYLSEEFGVMYPQKYGVFGLPDGQTLTNKYGNKTAQKKDGTTVYKFPALHYPLTVGYSGVNGIETGDWYLPGVDEGMMFMPDEPMALINATATKMDKTGVANNNYRWFAQRYGIIYAWSFDGNLGELGNSSVSSGFIVQAVALLDI